MRWRLIQILRFTKVDDESVAVIVLISFDFRISTVERSRSEEREEQKRCEVYPLPTIKPRIHLLMPPDQLPDSTPNLRTKTLNLLGLMCYPPRISIPLSSVSFRSASSRGRHSTPRTRHVNPLFIPSTLIIRIHPQSGPNVFRPFHRFFRGKGFGETEETVGHEVMDLVICKRLSSRCRAG